jgi:hypothetical protein
LLNRAGQQDWLPANKNHPYKKSHGVVISKQFFGKKTEPDDGR